MWAPGSTKVDDLRRFARKTIGNGAKRFVAVADNRTIGIAKVRELDPETCENAEKLHK